MAPSQPSQTASSLLVDATKPRRQKPTTSRSRASLACHSCRQRKIRCDIQSLPAGSRCTRCRNSNIECYVSKFSDRRKNGSREHLAALQDQIRSLDALVRRTVPTAEHSMENFGAHHGEQNVFSSHSADSSVSGSPNAQQLHEGAFTVVEQGPSGLRELVSANDSRDEHIQERRPAQGSATQPVADALSANNDAVLQEGSISNSTTHDIHFDGRSPSARQTSHSDFDAEANANSGAINERRQGSLHELGKINHANETISAQGVIFYGPTSNLHVSSPSEAVRTVPRVVPSDPEVQIDMDSPRLKNMLLNNYCNFQILSVPIIHRESFLSHRDLGLRSQHFSAFLETSILACSARLSTSAAVRALGSSYAKRAKCDILSELDDANLATLRGMLLLSDYEMSEGRDRVGWVYCGIACRLIFDLGLHKAWTGDTEQGSKGAGEIPSSCVALSCLIYETLWSLYLGRPAHIALSKLSIPASISGISSIPTLRAWYELSISMSEITLILNGASTLQPSTIERLSELDGHLRRWYTSLPVEIALDDNAISGLDATAYGLHMQFLRVQMLLHSLPKLTHKWRKQVDSLDQPALVLRNWTAEASHQLAHFNAVKIAQLGNTYRQMYGVEKIATVMLDNLYVAAATLISTVLGAANSTVNKSDWTK